jgi:hypothetical protein
MAIRNTTTPNAHNVEIENEFFGNKSGHWSVKKWGPNDDTPAFHQKLALRQ